MTHYTDLGPCDYFDQRWISCLCAVGWLEGGHDYNRGTPSSAFVDKLTELLQAPWQPEAFFGFHLCDFCAPEFTADPLDLPEVSVKHMARGGNNVFIPSGDLVYVAPSLVTHYIEAHDYCPPDEFCAAVLECPVMWSDEYFNALEGTDWCKVFEQDLKTEGESWTEFVKEQQQIHRLTPEEFNKFTGTMNDDAEPIP